MRCPAPLPAGLRVLAAIQITRPANALTAAADALAGIAVAWGISPARLPAGLWLLPLAAFLLYAGGVALDDVCDGGLDRDPRSESPSEPPISDGHISRPAALLLALALLATGVLAAALYSLAAGFLGATLAILIAWYATHGKHRPLLGPFSMGLCRSGSLLLGMTANLAGFAQGWPLAVIPLGYVMAITLIGRGASQGRNPHGIASLGVFVLVAIAYGFLAVTREQWLALVFVALFATLAWPPFVRAAEEPSSASIRAAVKAGVLSLVVCDAALAAAFAGPVTALAILLLLPVSRLLARLFPLA